MLSTMALRWSRLLLATAVAMTLGASSVEGNAVKGLGFYPPFQTFNARGERTVPSWTFGGATAAKESFARLTPDAVGNYGSMYSRLTGRFNTGPPGGQFSLAMSFRVSGANEKHHGKYLAVLIGNSDQLRRRGDTYGFPENFVGAGLVISPRTPADMAEPTLSRPSGPRQFVSFIANNGTRSMTDVRMEATSCASTMRYFQGRDDFNFLKASRVRMGFYENSVTVEVDARNIGVWRKCISARLDDMPPGWLDRVGVAISAETGSEVSNNHDVMSLEVFTERDEAFNSKVVDGAVEDDDTDEGDEEAQAAKRKERLYAIRAHLEHEIDSVERVLKDSVSKLASMNDNINKRITSIEKALSAEAVAFLNKRVRGIEDRVKANAAPALEVRIKDFQEEFHDEMKQSLEDRLGEGEGWRVPFFLFFALVLAIFGVWVKQYRRVMRSNLMGFLR